MISNLLFSETYSYFGGGGIGNALNSWAAAGFFDFVLPFLLIFALIFGVLIRVSLFPDNRAINTIIAFTVSLMSLQFGIIQRFFSEIFPLLGMGLVVILLILILTGLFTDPENTFHMWFMWVVGIIIVIIILAQTTGGQGWSVFGYWLSANWGGVVLTAVVIGFFVWMIAGGFTKPAGKPSKSPYSEGLRLIPASS